MTSIVSRPNLYKQIGSKSSLKVHNWLFYSLILLNFCLSGFLEMYTGGVYRQSFGILAAIPLALILRPNRVWTIRSLCFLLVLSVFISAVFGGSQLADFLLFLRGPVFVLLSHHIAAGWYKNQNRVTIKRFWRILLMIGILQLPLVVWQTLNWQLISSWVWGELHQVDAGFGSFAVKSDSTMVFFLIMLIITLQFGNCRIVSPLISSLLSVYFTLTILVANSQVMHLAIGLIWLIFFMAKFRVRKLIGLLLGLSVLAFAVYSLQEIGWMPLDLSVTLETARSQLMGQSSGAYNRGQVVRHFLAEPISLIGNGPGYYHNVLTRSVAGLDIQGHLLTYYGEVGFLGLVLSYILFGAISYMVSFQNMKLYIRLFALIPFVVLVMQSSTSYVANSFPAMLIYSLTVFPIQTAEDQY